MTAYVTASGSDRKVEPFVFSTLSLYVCALRRTRHVGKGAFDRQLQGLVALTRTYTLQLSATPDSFA